MQTTVAKSFDFEGVGLHSGRMFRVSVIPAPVDNGIRFKRADVSNCEFVRITPYNVSSTQLATTVDCGGLPISTIEHLMAAFYGLGVDNAFVEVSGPEIPILDGSALPIVKLIKESGLRVQDKPRQVLKVTRPISIEHEGKTVEISAYKGFKITFELDYPNTLIGKQVLSYKYKPDTFVKDIAFARTFGFQREVEALRSMGLALGGSLDNAIVIGNDNNVANPDGLRAKDEFVRHKILDMYGDLSLIGYRIEGSITAAKSGHHVNNIFARTLLEATNSYEIIEHKEQPVVQSEKILKEVVLIPRTMSI